MKKHRILSWPLFVLAICSVAFGCGGGGGGGSSSKRPYDRFINKAYGVHTTWNLNSVGGAANYYQTMTDLDVQVVRFSVRWRFIEAVEGTRDWSIMDDHVNEAVANGISPNVIIATSPQWLNGSTDMWEVPDTEPEFSEWVDAYALWVRDVILRYRDRVSDWELWNEPNLTQFWAPQPDLDQYYTWASRMYQVIRKYHPTANIAWGALAILDVAYNAQQIAGPVFLQGIYDRGSVPEVVSVHPYAFGNEDPDTHAPNDGKNTFQDVQTIRDVMLANEPPGTDSAIWITEFGWRVDETAGNPPITITDEMQADYLQRALEIAESDEWDYLRRVIWFWDWDRPSTTFNGYGLLREGLAAVRRPAGEIFELAAELMPIYENGFEEDANFVTGGDEWAVWTNDAIGPAGTVGFFSHGVSKPRGGRDRGLVLQSGVMDAGGAFPGLYAQTPEIPITADTEYGLTFFHRNDDTASFQVLTFDASDVQTGAFGNSLSTDAVNYSQERLDFTAPAGTSKMIVRFRVRSDNTTVEVDVLRLGTARHAD